MAPKQPAGQVEPLLRFDEDGVSSVATRHHPPRVEPTVSAFDSRAVPDLGRRQRPSPGKKWYEIEDAQLTRALKDDLQAVQMRNVLDRKRFYKSSDFKKNALPTKVQVGTVVEGPTEYFSGRLPRKQRRQTIVAELMSDADTRRYVKRKFLDVQRETQRGGKRDMRAQARARRPKWVRNRHSST